MDLFGKMSANVALNGKIQREKHIEKLIYQSFKLVKKHTLTLT